MAVRTRVTRVTFVVNAARSRAFRHRDPVGVASSFTNIIQSLQGEELVPLTPAFKEMQRKEAELVEDRSARWHGRARASPGSYDPRDRGPRRPVLPPPAGAAPASASSSPPPAPLAEAAAARPGRGVPDLNRQS